MRTQKLFSFFIVLLSVLAGTTAFAEAGSAEAATAITDIGVRYLAAAIAIGAATTGGAIGMGRTVSAALEGMARNPSASGKLFTPMILGVAFIESLAIYALIISFMSLP